MKPNAATAARADLARFLDSTPADAGRILVRCAAALASAETPQPAGLIAQTLRAADALMSPRGFLGEAVEMAESAAAELSTRYPRAWQAAQARA